MRWCFTSKNPVELIEPSSNLAHAYIEKSKDSLEMAQLAIKADKKEWAVTAMYYCQYLILYGLLQKIGIKSENHTCSILLTERFIKKVGEEHIKQIKDFKDERIERQYYVAKSDIEALNIGLLNGKAKRFYYYFVELINTITEKEIIEIRNEIKSYIAGIRKQ